MRISHGLFLLVIVATSCFGRPNDINNFPFLKAGIETEQKPADEGKHWAVIVAGSNGYYNYRHQADACHAYHVLSNHGIPDERIVVMMYDDIADSEENPLPGTIINHPKGPNVYKGVLKDYTKETVTPDNFLNILQGNKQAMAGIGSGKVIESGPNDHVFVYFTDHGAPGLIAFPDDELHARPLNEAIKNMYKQKKFKQMVLYIEACESGSMFDSLLPDNINVWATTAANPNESSYACYYDNTYQTYLGDLYSVKWMEDSDKEDLKAETLKKQFKIVKQETNTSHVMQYGNKKISSEAVSEFQGKVPTEPQILPQVPLDAVPSEMVPLAILHHRLTAAKTSDEEAEILGKMNRLIKKQGDILKSMQAITSRASGSPEQASRLMNTRHPLRSYDCYEAAVEQYDRECFDISTNDYALRHLYAVVNMCEEKIPTRTILDTIYHICSNKLY